MVVSIGYNPYVGDENVNSRFSRGGASFSQDLALWRMRQMREALLRAEPSSSRAASLRFPRRQEANRLEPAGQGS